MGDAELLNELKRLQNVIIALNNQLAQDVIVNENLANVITELQNSNVNLAGVVAQQVVTNTNLGTQIARLTTITGQLVTVNIRALDEADTPHTPLPYRQYSNIPAAINPATNNWGWTYFGPFAEDRYVTAFSVSAYTAVATPWFVRSTEGISIWIAEERPAWVLVGYQHRGSYTHHNMHVYTTLVLLTADITIDPGDMWKVVAGNRLAIGCFNGTIANPLTFETAIYYVLAP